jgi:hypothetical protein
MMQYQLVQQQQQQHVDTGAAAWPYCSVSDRSHGCKLSGSKCPVGQNMVTAMAAHLLLAGMTNAEEVAAAEGCRKHGASRMFVCADSCRAVHAVVRKYC